MREKGNKKVVKIVCPFDFSCKPFNKIFLGSRNTGDSESLTCQSCFERCYGFRSLIKHVFLAHGLRICLVCLNF